MAYITKEELERISDQDMILRKRQAQRFAIGVGMSVPPVVTVPPGFDLGAIGFSNLPPRTVPDYPKAQAMTPAEVIEDMRCAIYDLEKDGLLIEAKAMRRGLDAYRAELKKEGEGQ